MARRTHTPPDVPAALDPIELLHSAIVRAAEENWDFAAVSPAERDRLRPGILATAAAVADGLRRELASRGGAPC